MRGKKKSHTLVKAFSSDCAGRISKCKLANQVFRILPMNTSDLRQKEFLKLYLSEPNQLRPPKLKIAGCFGSDVLLPNCTARARPVLGFCRSW